MIRKPYTIHSTNMGMEEETIEDSAFGEVPTRVLTDSMIKALEEGN